MKHIKVIHLMKYVENGTWHDMFIEAIGFKLRNMNFQKGLLVSNEHFLCAVIGFSIFL